ncbi:MAG TPA: tetratricopeptide repeat protein, partial [Thermoanaerobaculia bacterium]|nr:tetratricopeptide repeat protein [Thermoanaerobaculia bacterium]
MRKLQVIVFALFALRLFAANPADLMTSGKAALDRGDYEKAEELFAKAVAADPKSAQAHYLLGAAYGEHAQNANMFSQASLAKKTKAEFEKAVELDPSHIQARFALIDYYLIAPSFMGGSAEKAQAQVEEIRKRDALDGHRAQARVYSRQKKTDLARKEFVDAVREQPNSAKAHYFLGGFLINTDKNWAGAQHELDMAIKLDPAYMPPYFRIGQLAARSESNYARGEESLRKYLAYKPGENEPNLASAW